MKTNFTNYYLVTPKKNENFRNIILDNHNNSFEKAIIDIKSKYSNKEKLVLLSLDDENNITHCLLYSHNPIGCVIIPSDNKDYVGQLNADLKIINDLWKNS